MPLDDVACDLRRMARRKVLRNAEPILHIEVSGIVDPGWEAGILQVLNPPRATSAARIAMNCDRRLIGCKGRSKFKCGSQAESQLRSGHRRVESQRLLRHTTIQRWFIDWVVQRGEP